MTDNYTHLKRRVHWKGSFNKKWQMREVTLAKGAADGPYSLTIASVTGLSKVLRISRNKVVVLGPSIAVLPLGEFEGRRNVLGLMQVNQTGSQMLLSCDCSDVFMEVKQKVQECCTGRSFQVTIGGDQKFPPGSAVLHMFRKQLHLLSNSKGSPVNILGQWHVESSEQIRQVKDGVMLNIGNSAEPHWIILSTAQGDEIIGLLEKYIEYAYVPLKPERSSTCDLNQNEDMTMTRLQGGPDLVEKFENDLTQNEQPAVWVRRSSAKSKPVGNDDNDLSSSSTDGSCQSSCLSGSQRSSQRSSLSSDSSLASLHNSHQEPSNHEQKESVANITNENQSNLLEDRGVSLFGQDGRSRQPPKCYVYINQENSLRGGTGPSIKHCYENLNYLQDQSLPPPLHPRKRAPDIPPRGASRTNAYNVPPQLPPKKCCKPVIPPRPGQHPQVQVGVFASPCILDHYWFLRVAVMCKDCDDGTMKRVKEHEAQCNHHFLKSQPLLVESDIKIALDTTSRGFDYEDSEGFQCVEFEDVKNLQPGDWFVIEFHLKSTGMETQFFGKVYIGPSSDSSDYGVCGANRRLNIGVAETFVANTAHGQPAISQVPQPALPPTTSLSLSSPPSRRSQPSQDILANYEKRTQICRALDVMYNTENNWKLVAARLNLPIEHISQLTDKAYRLECFSPMEAVLKSWQERDPCSCNWETLKKILQDIHRLDIIQDVEHCK